jgi:hypothetical protein
MILCKDNITKLDDAREEEKKQEKEKRKGKTSPGWFRDLVSNKQKVMPTKNG